MICRNSGCPNSTHEANPGHPEIFTCRKHEHRVINPVSISKPKLTAFEIVKRCAIFPDNAPISVILAGGTIRSLALDVRSQSGDLMLYQFPTLLTLGQLRAKLLSSSMSPSLNTGNMEILLSDPMSVNPPAPVVNTSADPYTYEIMLHV